MSWERIRKDLNKLEDEDLIEALIIWGDACVKETDERFIFWHICESSLSGALRWPHQDQEKCLNFLEQIFDYLNLERLDI